MEVAIIGPNAIPANLAEFKKPMIPPFGSMRNIDMIKGRVAATSPVWIIRIRVKSMIPLLKANRAWKRMLRVKRRVMILMSPYFLDNQPQR